MKLLNIPYENTTLDCLPYKKWLKNNNIDDDNSNINTTTDEDNSDTEYEPFDNASFNENNISNDDTEVNEYDVGSHDKSELSDSEHDSDNDIIPDMDILPSAMNTIK